MQLDEAEAAIKNINMSQIIKGHNMSGKYMAAYSGTSGFVGTVEATGWKDTSQKLGGKIRHRNF